MAKLTIEKARRILGKLADNVPDEQLEQDIKAAEVIKNLFFQKYITAKKATNIYNDTNHGKT